MEKTLLCLGFGYCADHLARFLAPLGWSVRGTTRSPQKAEAMRARGVAPLIWGVDDIEGAIQSAQNILVSAAPKNGDPVLAAYGAAVAAADLRWLGYLSTTSVYGDHDGGWVDETAPLVPVTERGRKRVQAEADWAATGAPLHVFRLGGVYGVGRGPFAKLRAGKTNLVIKPGQVFSRSHVEDIAQTLHASLTQPNSGSIYNVVDDNPAPPQEVLRYACDLLKIPYPPEVPFETADLSPIARSFYAENKRVRNARIKDELGVVLKYPDYTSGLRQILAQEG